MANTRLTGKLVIIEDSLGINAKNIIIPLIENENPSVLCIEKTIDKWKSVFQSNLKYKYYSDIVEFTNALKQNNSDSVVIDSFNQLAALTNWEESLRLLDELNKNSNIKRVILIVHRDCLIYGEKMLKQLKYISNAYISMKYIIGPQNYRVEIITVSSGGKIIKSTNDIFFDTAEKKWKNVERKENNKTETKTNDVINNMTSFKISVEKEAELIKGDLVLPFTEVINNKNKLIAEPNYDDWDDEDPDDDLSI